MQSKAGLRGAPLIPYKNFYTVIPKEILSSIPEIKYKNFNKMRIKLPSTIILLGSSGSGKTNWLLHFLSLVDSYDTVTIYARNTSEPLYVFLIQSLNAAGIPCEVHNDLENVKDPLEFDSRLNNCVIADDFMSAPKKSLEPLGNIANSGRKQNITFIWITQSYFLGTPQAIRQNASYIVIFKLKTRGDAKRICADSSLDMDPDDLLQKLAYIQSNGQGQFMMLDKNTTVHSQKFRENWGNGMG